MVYNSEQTGFEKVVATGLAIIVLLSAGVVLLRFLVPGALQGPGKGVRIVDIPGEVDPLLEHED